MLHGIADGISMPSDGSADFCLQHDPFSLSQCLTSITGIELDSRARLFENSVRIFICCSRSLLHFRVHFCHALLTLSYTQRLVAIFRQLLLHERNQALARLMRTILVDEMVDVVEDGLQMFNLLCLVSGVSAQDAYEFEKVEKDRTRKGEEVGGWVWTAVRRIVIGH